MSTRVPRRLPRLAVVVPAGVLMLAGLYAGLMLIGVDVPWEPPGLAERHSALLVFGFVGTLISLERAVALRRTWAFLAPILILGGALLLFMPVSAWTGPAAVALGMGAHVAQYVGIWRRQQMTATAVQAAGAVSGVFAAVLWTSGVPMPRLVPLLAVFLILTIAGERLELARLNAPGPRAEAVLLALSLSLAASALLTLTMPDVATVVTGVLLLALVAWLLRYDVIRATIRQPGLPRFVAVCLFAGYFWLALAGLGWVVGRAQSEGLVHDATTHAIFLGFVITAIMAHAPVILPAVLRLSIPFHPALYAPVALLHASLIVRVVAGDLWADPTARAIGGAGAVAAILLFAATAIVVGIRTSIRTRREDATHVAP